MRHIYNLVIMVLILCLTSCGEHSASAWLDEPEPDPEPQPQPKPEVVVTGVEKIGCQTKNINWVAKNAQFNKTKNVGSQELEAYVAAITDNELSVNVTYSDGSVQTETALYNETIKFGFVGLSEYREISDMSIFDVHVAGNEIEKNTLDKQVFLFDFSGVKIYSVISHEKSKNEIMFHGNSISTCNNSWKIEYIGANYYPQGEQHEKDGKLYTPYKVELTFSVEANAEKGNVILDVNNIFLVENAPIKEPEPEFVSYIWENEGFNHSGDGKIITYGTLKELWSDGETRNPVQKSCELSWSAWAPADQEHYTPDTQIGEIAYQQGKYIGAVYGSGEYTLTRYTVKQTLNTQYFSCVFEGFYEKASFKTPNGETIEMAYPELTFGNMYLDEEGGKNENYEVNNINVSTTADIRGKSLDLSCNVKLLAYIEPIPTNPVQTGMYIENERVEGDYIVFDVVQVFDSKPEERTTEKFLHGCGMDVENQLTTQVRQYGVLGTSPAKKSEKAFTALGGKVNGVTEVYENMFSYADFNNTITYFYPANLTYSENGFTDAININAAVVNKTGSETATTPSRETENSKTYNDKIYYSMLFGGAEVANGVQGVVYTETVEPAPEPTPATYEGYHVVASRSARALVFDEPWTTYICDHVEFENDNNASDRFVLLKIWKAERSGNSWVFAKDQKGNAIKVFEEKIKGYWCGKGYPAATYVKNTSKWTLGYLTSDNGYKETWKQVAEVGTNGEGVTINPLVISKKTQGTSPEISRGNWNSTTKTYTLEGVEYR